MELVWSFLFMLRWEMNEVMASSERWGMARYKWSEKF